MTRITATFIIELWLRQKQEEIGIRRAFGYGRYDVFGYAYKQIFKKINDVGKTVILITHDMDVAKCCERQIIIEDGVIL